MSSRMDSGSSDFPSDVTIAIGDEVRGRDGKLGQVERVIVDANSDRISEIVVKHGLPLLGEQRLIPLSHVQRSDGSVLYVDIDSEQFKECEGFKADRYRAPNPDYTGPPGFDARSGHNFPLDAAVDSGPVLFQSAGGKMMGYPGGEGGSQGSLMSRPSISPGDDVLSADYEKVGEVAEFELNADGFPTRLVVRQGFLFRTEAEVPAEWIRELSDQGVVLRAPAAEIERLLDRAN